MNIANKFYRILGLFISLLCSCKNITIKSLYNNDIINNKKICFYLNVDDLFSKTLINNLKEFPYVSDYHNCDYFVVIFNTNNDSNLTNISGINLKNQFNTELQYYLFEFNKRFVNEVVNVLKNSNTENNEQFVGRKNYYFSNQINNYGAIKMDYQSDGQQNIENNKTTINKLQEYIILLKKDTLKKSLVYNYNVVLPVSIDQEKTDAEKQLAKAMSEKIMTDIISYIIDKQQIK